MKIYLESTVECTVDGVGLLEPGKPVEVDPQLFQVFHKVRPADAKFPPSVQVVIDTERVTEKVEETAEETVEEEVADSSEEAKDEEVAEVN